MIIAKGAREDAIHALINVWLKDKTLVCGWCNTNFKEGSPDPCCEQPFIGTNADIFRQFQAELAVTRGKQKNDFASTEKKDLRHVLSFPPGLMQYLTIGFYAMYGEELFNDQYDLIWFAKHFGKYFGVPQKL